MRSVCWKYFHYLFPRAPFAGTLPQFFEQSLFLFVPLSRGFKRSNSWGKREYSSFPKIYNTFVLAFLGVPVRTGMWSDDIPPGYQGLQIPWYRTKLPWNAPDFRLVCTCTSSDSTTVKEAYYHHRVSLNMLMIEAISFLLLFLPRENSPGANMARTETWLRHPSPLSGPIQPRPGKTHPFPPSPLPGNTRVVP